jgi:hypothetical protein
MERMPQFHQHLIALQHRERKTGFARAWAHVGLAKCLTKLGEPINIVIDEYFQALQHIPKGWHQTGTQGHNRDKIEMQVTIELSALYARKGDINRAFDITNEMLGDERHLIDPKFGASLHDHLGRLYLGSHLSRLGIEQFQESLRLRGSYAVDTVRDGRPQPRCGTQLAESRRCISEASRRRKGEQRVHECSRLVGESREMARRTRCALRAGGRTIFAGNAPEAETTFLDAIRRTLENHDERGTALTEANMAVHLKRIGDLDQAEYRIESACAKLKALGDLKALAQSLMTAATIFIVEWKWPKAEQALKAAVRL